MGKVKVGIVGSGFAALTHAEALRYDGRAALVGIAGGSRAPALAEEYGARCYGSVADLIASPDVDGVIICTPHHLHAEETLQAVRHKKHILVEKPMATSTEDCQRMIAAAEENDVRLMVAHFQRYRKTNASAKEALDAGRTGKPLLAYFLLAEEAQHHPWQAMPENKGFLLGYGIHAVDLLRWWLGSEVGHVSALSKNYKSSGVEHSSLVLMQFANETSAFLLSSSAMPAVKKTATSPGAAFCRAQIIGEEGVLNIDLYGRTTLEDAQGNHLLYELPAWDDVKSPQRIEAYAEQDSEFISSILENRMPAIPGQEGLRNVEVCLAAYRAAGKIESQIRSAAAGAHGG